MRYLRIFLFIPFMFYSSSSFANYVTYVHSTRLPHQYDLMKPEIVHQPNGPFAAIVFPEDALGNYLGIIFYDTVSQPFAVNSSWSLEDRFWQDRKWASDITSFAWGPSGKYLYVATSEIYGDGGIFRLNLLQKTATKIYPTEETYKKLNLDDNEGYESEITGISENKMKIKITIYNDQKETEIESELPIE